MGLAIVATSQPSATDLVAEGCQDGERPAAERVSVASTTATLMPHGRGQRMHDASLMPSGGNRVINFDNSLSIPVGDTLHEHSTSAAARLTWRV